MWARVRVRVRGHGAHEHVRLEVLDDRLGRGSMVSRCSIVGPVGKAS